MVKIILVLTLCFGVSVYGQSQLSALETANLVKDLSNVAIQSADVRPSVFSRSGPSLEEQAFGDSDRVIAERESLRPIFGSNAPETKQAALLSESQAALLSDRIGLETTEVFDPNGMPLSEEVANITIQVVEKQTCIFDEANSKPCSSEFREPTGRCANAEEGRRTWGMAGTPFSRILPNRYEDGIQEHRTSEFSSPSRPAMSARKISETVTDTLRVLGEDFSTQVMQWGQFIAHEFTLIGELEEHLACCPDEIFRQRNGDEVEPTSAQLDEIRQEIQELRGDICIAIENEDDTVFGGYVCMEHTRSTIAPNHDCSAGPRQQANLNTHLMDGSAVYGSSQESADKLRSFKDGMMAVQTFNGRILPPVDEEAECPASAAGRCPMLGGDIRINETPNLASMHAFMLLTHNNFATELKKINPQWDDERLYQETRRIIAGIESSIHYDDFLPLALGSTIYEKWIGPYQGFNSTVNPSVLNELAGAAMRFGHSIVEGDYPTIEDDGTVIFRDLRNHFFDHDIVYEIGVDAHMRGVLATESGRVDKHIPTQMRNQLMNMRRDIIALNINRGRDHGFASYLDYKRNYGLSIPSDFDDMKATHPEEVVEALKNVYTTVEDIELYIGGVTENPTEDGFLGPTFANILGDGFGRLRDGDRLFYASPEGGLTEEQIGAIEDYTLAQLLCVGGNVGNVSRNAFFHSTSSKSETVACSSLDKFNFELWREEEVKPVKCYWYNVAISKCCRGERTVLRKCVGKSEKCNCEGEAKITVSCSCPPNDFICILYNKFC